MIFHHTASGAQTAMHRCNSTTLWSMNEPSKHCSTGTIPAQYRGYCRNGTGPPLLCVITATFVTVIYRFAHRHFTGPVLVNCYPAGISRHNYITLPVSREENSLAHITWPSITSCVSCVKLVFLYFVTCLFSLTIIHVLCSCYQHSVNDILSAIIRVLLLRFSFLLRFTFF